MAVKYQLFTQDAQKVSSQTGVPASVILAQLILESSGKYENGLSYLGAKFNNLFGVKGKGTAGSISLPTTEYVNGQYVSVNSNFRAYNTPYESILDHSKVLQNKRYTQYTANAKTVGEYIEGIARGGYATDPNYANKLKKIVSQYNLTQYDKNLPPGYSLEHTGDVKTGSAASGSAASGSAATASTKDLNMAEKIFLSVSRVVAIGGLIVIMLVFFMKAFPAVENVSNVLPIKRMTKGVKK